MVFDVSSSAIILFVILCVFSDNKIINTNVCIKGRCGSISQCQDFSGAEKCVLPDMRIKGRCGSTYQRQDYSPQELCP